MKSPDLDKLEPYIEALVVELINEMDLPADTLIRDIATVAIRDGIKTFAAHPTVAGVPK